MNEHDPTDVGLLANIKGNGLSLRVRCGRVVEPARAVWNKQLQLRVLARALHALARVGDDLYIDMMIDKLLLRTVNSTQSAFAEFIFFIRFFVFYRLENDENEETPKCKISMKSFMTVFKSPNSMDRMVDGCELRLEPNASQIILKIQYSNGSTKTHFLPIIECESLQVKYRKNVPYRLAATAKLLSGAVKNFRVNEDEITLSVSPQNTFLKTHMDTNIESSKTVHTELCLLAEEFESYTVENALSVTFCLKQLRAVVIFAESTNLPITILFESPGRPVLFCVNNEAIYEGNFVVSSLSTTDSQMSTSQVSELSVASERQQQPTKKRSFVLSNNSDNGLESHTKATLQVPNNSNPSCSSASRKRSHLRDENMDFEFDNSNDNNEYPQVIGCSDNLSVNESNNMDAQNGNQTTNNSLISTVFGRCFNATFKLNMLPGYDKVLAYDSDGLEDPD